MEHSCNKPLINFLFDTFPLQGKPVFLEELRQFVPTKTPEEISHHEVWYKQYLDLQEKKKVAIQMWKARKEVGFVTVSNTDGTLLCHDPVCVTGYQERCYCFNDSRYLPEILVYLLQCNAIIMQLVSSKILTIDTPYLALMGEIWGVFCEFKVSYHTVL